MELTAMLTENKDAGKKKDRVLLENFLREDDFEPKPMGGGQPQGNMPPMNSQGGEQQMPPQDFDEDFPMQGMMGGSGDKMAQEQGILPIKNEIDQIRQIALKTIAKLAENPTAESYQMMKKIWMMCDKAIESALQPEDDDKKKSSF